MPTWRIILVPLIHALLVGCGAGNVQHEYPNQVEVQVVKSQAKYGLLDKEFDMYDSQKPVQKQLHATETCKKIEFLASQYFDGIEILESSKEACLLKATNKLDKLKTIQIVFSDAAKSSGLCKKIKHATATCGKIEFLSSRYFPVNSVVSSNHETCMLIATNKTDSLRIIQILLSEHVGK